MKGLVIILMLLSLFSLPTLAFAQDEETTLDQMQDLEQVDDSENLDVVLSYASQSPSSKEFYLIAEINSGIDSDRVVVEWKLPSGIKFADSTESRYSRPTVSAGQTTTVQKRLVATYAGTREIEVVATAVKADVNYVSSDKIELQFNDSKEIIPQSEEYKNAKLMHQIVLVLLYLGLGALVLTGGYLGYRWIKSIRS
ncbi:hypothetical protein JW978_00835 [Candidatus Dojkabacteria bacterium]|nr:hypothetical protein [Candidatus Dojkabacteria bacterium]